ncbi:MAG: YceD family protein [Sphingomonas sp.]
MTPEFSRPERLDTIGTRERAVTIEATPKERAALAERFGLAALDNLSADLVVRRESRGILVNGRVRAAVTQSCVVTDEPVPATIDEPVELLFVEAVPDGSDEEIELGEAELDTLPITGGSIDLGEAAAETVALALDLYPRAPGAAEVLREAGVVTEEEVRPAGKLAGLGALLAKHD